VCDLEKFVIEEALAHWGLSCQIKKKNAKKAFWYAYLPLEILTFYEEN